MAQSSGTQRHPAPLTGIAFNHKGAVEWKVIPPSICLCERSNMFATAMGSSAGEMGANLIRMHTVFGKLKVGVRDYHLVERLPGWITRPSSDACSRASGYQRLPTTARSTGGICDGKYPSSVPVRSFTNGWTAHTVHGLAEP